MTRVARRAVACLAVLAVAAGVGACGDGSPGDGVVVLAAASLSPVSASLADLAGDTELAGDADVDATFSFGGTPALLEQVRQGAPADVVLAADVDQLAPLVRDGLVGEPVVFALNHLTGVVRPGAERIETLGEFAADGVRVVLASPEVPAGRHAREGLEALGLAGGVLANVVSEEPDVRSVVAKVALGEADAGIVYVTDARADDRLRAVGTPLPSPTRYGAAVVADAGHPDAARRFVGLLRSPAAERVLTEAGFDLPAP